MKNHLSSSSAKPRFEPKVENIKLHFLTKWSVENYQVASLALPIEGMPGPMAATLGALATPRLQTYIGATVGFDYNSVHHVRPLTSEEQSFLLGECLNQISRDQRECG